MRWHTLAFVGSVRQVGGADGEAFARGIVAARLLVGGRAGVVVVALAFAGGHGVLACGINAEKTIGLGEMMKFRRALAALTGRVGRSTGDPAAPQLVCRPRVRHHGAHQIRTRAQTGARCMGGRSFGGWGRGLVIV